LCFTGEQGLDGAPGLPGPQGENYEVSLARFSLFKPCKNARILFNTVLYLKSSLVALFSVVSVSIFIVDFRIYHVSLEIN
jgi:hypothetical protein